MEKKVNKNNRKI